MINSELEKSVIEASQVILEASCVTAFTGAGISVESGIPPFRGENGLWNRYNPQFLEIGYFLNRPEASWKLIKEIFYDYFGKAEPNLAHTVLARMETAGLLQTVITQNIDNLHQLAGSKNVLEFHGHSRTLICMDCTNIFSVGEIGLQSLPPLCKKCSGLLKPEFIFFGEGIPEPANSLSFKAAEESDVFLIVGSTGEIMPASMIPSVAKQRGAAIVEINIEPSLYTGAVTDIFLQGRATEVFRLLARELKLI